MKRQAEGVGGGLWRAYAVGASAGTRGPCRATHEAMLRHARRGGGRPDPAAKLCLLKCGAGYCALPATVSVAQTEPSAPLLGDGADGARADADRAAVRALVAPDGTHRATLHARSWTARPRLGAGSSSSALAAEAESKRVAGPPTPHTRRPRRGSARHRTGRTAPRPRPSADAHRLLTHRFAPHGCHTRRRVAQCWRVSAPVGREPRGRGTVARFAARGAAGLFFFCQRYWHDWLMCTDRFLAAAQA